MRLTLDIQKNQDSYIYDSNNTISPSSVFQSTASHNFRTVMSIAQSQMSLFAATSLCKALFYWLKKMSFKPSVGYLIHFYWGLTVFALSVTDLYLLCSFSHTVCSSPWPVTWAMTSHQLRTPQWTSTCQLLQPCSPRNTDETETQDFRKNIKYLWCHTT